MIIGSLLLLVAGAGFLIVGLANGNDSFLIGTIVASLLAAVLLYVGSRKGNRRGSTVADDPEEFFDGDADGRLRTGGGQRRNRSTDQDRRTGTDTDEYSAAEDSREASGSRKSSRQDYLDIDVDTGAVPSDEPAEIQMSSVEAAALMRMDAEVMVVDGRPRFHLGGCVHLIGRDPEPLPAYEAVELGFSACALCRPAQSLLREPTRR